MAKSPSNESSIQPVWQAMGAILQYPLKASVLPMLLMCTAAMLLSLLPGLLGLIAGLFIWATLFKLSYEILASTARGEMDGPPPITQISGGIIFKHMGILLVVLLAYLLAVWLTGSLVVALLLAIVLAAAVPAAIMVLAMTQSLTQALNPVNWVEIVRQTGWAYVLTVIFLAMMSITETQSERLVLPLFDSLIILTLLSTFISAYFMAASFHLMGYLLYQHHEALGIELSDHRPLAEKAPSPRHGNASAALDDWREREQQIGGEAVCRELGKSIERDGAEPALHEYYRQLLRQSGDQQRLLDHAALYVTVLLHGFEDSERALELTAESQAVDRDFLPRQPEDVRLLAELAQQQGRHDLVLRLTSAFGRHHRDHAHLVDNFLLAAKSMVAHRNQRDKALALVQRLRRRYPDHPLAEDMAAFEQRLA